MTRDQELRQESAFCRKSALDARDPIYRLALIELADWWEWQADLARQPSPIAASAGLREHAMRERASRLGERSK